MGEAQDTIRCAVQETDSGRVALEHVRAWAGLGVQSAPKADSITMDTPGSPSSLESSQMPYGTPE